MVKKKGRPTNNPKTSSFNARLDNECVDILNEYCEKHNVTRTEAIRKGIKKLKDDLGK